MKHWIGALWRRGQIGQTVGPLRRASNPDFGSQLEDLRIHVLRCERWAHLEDRLDLALRTSRRKRAR